MPLPHVPGHGWQGRWWWSAARCDGGGQRATVPFVSRVAAAALGCRFATAYRALTVHGRLAAGDPGDRARCGGVGLSPVLIGVALGALAPWRSTCPLPRCGGWAELGAAATIDACERPDAAATVREVIGRGGPRVGRCGRAAYHGGRVGSVAAPPGTAPAGRLAAGGLRDPAAGDGPGGRLEVRGSHRMAAHDYPPMLGLVADGVLLPGLLVTRVLPLAAAPRWPRWTTRRPAPPA